MTASIAALWESYKHARQNGQRPLTNIGRAQQDAFTAGAHAVLALQAGWDDLTDREALDELRAGEASLYWPIFMDEPAIYVDCGGCGRRTLIDVEGLCGDCGWELT